MMEQFQSGYALLISIDENSVKRWALPDVAKDVDALYEVLTHPQRCAYLPEHVKVLKGQAATRQGLEDGLDWLHQQLSADGSGSATVVIYYTGHGWRDKSAKPNYFLIPYDVRETNIPLSALRAEDFASSVAGMQPQRLLVVLDCCHAAGMEAKDLDEVAGGFSGSAIPAAVFMADEQGVLPDENGKGLEELAQGTGRAVLSSSSADQKSYIRNDGRMSIFTYHLIEALTGHAEPEGGATEVLISDVMGYVYRHVPQTAITERGKPQQPDYQVSGNFPVALILGGKGLSKGEDAPNPLSLPTAAATSAGPKVNTGGGAYIGGNVSAGRDFVGRDQITYGDSFQTGDISGSAVAMGRGASANLTSGLSPRDLLDVEPLFTELLSTVADQASADKRDAAVQRIDELKREVTKGKQANDKRVAGLIDGLVALVPGAVGAVVSMFVNPILGGIAGPATEYVLDKIQGQG